MEAFRNNEDTAEAIRRHKVEMYDREMRAGILEQQAYERMKQAQKVERGAEISRVETMARDYNDKYYKYEDVLRGIKQLNSDLSLKLYPLNDAAFLTYQELNMSRREQSPRPTDIQKTYVILILPNIKHIVSQSLIIYGL